MCLSGAVIWWPGFKNMRRGLLLRWNTSWKRFNWNLHSVIGFWSFCFVFMWALSGVYLVFPEPFYRVIDVIAPPNPSIGSSPAGYDARVVRQRALRPLMGSVGEDPVGCPRTQSPAVSRDRRGNLVEPGRSQARPRLTFLCKVLHVISCEHMDGPAGPPALHTHAAENLRFIRETMARAATFTAVPGWGGVLMGTSALVTAAAAHRAPSRVSGWASGLGDAAVAAAIGLVAIVTKHAALECPRRRRRGGSPRVSAGAGRRRRADGVFGRDRIVDRPARRLASALWRRAFVRRRVFGEAVPVMGWAFMLLGAIAFLSLRLGRLLHGGRVRVLHIGFGVVIARRYGG